jgi:hypothetical protein
MKRTLTLFAAIAAIALSLAACGKSSNVSTQSAGASSAPAAGGTVLVTTGTVFTGKLGEEISTKKSHNGDTFTLTQHDTMFHHQAPGLQGAVIDGHVDNVSPAGMGKKPSMTIVFDDIKLANGQTAPINVKIQNIGAFDAKSHHWRTIGLVLGAGMAGHMAAGQHHGGLLGAAGGYMLSQEMKTDVDVKPGTLIEVKFLSDAVAGASASPEASGT